MNEAGAGDANGHGIWSMAIEAADGVGFAGLGKHGVVIGGRRGLGRGLVGGGGLDGGGTARKEGVAFAGGAIRSGEERGVGLGVGHFAGGFKAFEDGRPIKIGSEDFGAGVLTEGFEAEAAVHGEDGSVAVKASAALGAFGDALGDFLIEEHVGMAAEFAVIDAEGVTRVEAAEPWLLLEFAFGHGAGAAIGGLDGIHGAAIGIELAGPVDTPGDGVGGAFIDFDETDEGSAGFLLVLKDGDEESGDAEGDEGDGHDQGAEEQPAAAWLAGRGWLGCSRRGLAGIDWLSAHCSISSIFGSSSGVADIRMALDAEEHVPSFLGREHLMDEVAMAVQAGVLGDAAVAGFDLNGFVKIFEGEGE